jgi:hypothetical protein
VPACTPAYHHRPGDRHEPLTWTDDELLRELSAALREPPVDAVFIRMAQAAFAWRTVDADLESRRLGPAGPAS